jgi:carboxylate-amine ligase
MEHLLEFSKSSACTFGVELELQLISPRDFNLTRGASDLLARTQKLKLSGEVKPEITESMVELNSSVHTRHDALLEELKQLRDAVVREAERANLRVAGGGAHPFHKWSDRRIYPTERFNELSAKYGYLSKQFTVFGQHIHIGCASGDDAVYLTHMLSRYVPHFIAMSASSPFFQGEDTSFDSSRLTAVRAFPLSGTMPFVGSWDEFTAFYRKMLVYGIVKSMKDFYWDIRPKPEYGTVEIRVCDTPLTVALAAHLAAYAQTLARYLLEERPERPTEDIYLLYATNHFQACRYGLDARFINPYGQTHVSLRQDILETLTRVAPHSKALGTGDALGELMQRVAAKANGSSWLRAQLHQRGSLVDVVRQQAQVWASDEVL